MTLSDLYALEAELTPGLQAFMRGRTMNSGGFLAGRQWVKKQLRDEFETEADYKAFLKRVDIILKVAPEGFEPGTFVFGLVPDEPELWHE